MNRWLIILGWMLWGWTSLMAQEVQVSLLLSKPSADRYYGVFGHAALRIVSEELDADYVYNYVGDEMGNKWRLVTGRMRMGLRMKPTNVYLEQEFRTVDEYPLRLPDEMVMALCQLLYEETEKGYRKAYNPIAGSCAQMVWHYLVVAAQRAGTPIEVDEWDEEYSESLTDIASRYDQGHELLMKVIRLRYGGDEDIDNAGISKNRKVKFPEQLLPLLKKAIVNGEPILTATKHNLKRV